MNKKKYAILIVAIVVICSFVYIMRNNFDKGDYSQTYYNLGTVSQITLFDVNKSDADEILKECGDILLDVDNTMSKNRQYSEISKINQNAGKEYTKVSEETFFVIENALNFSNISNGVFDVTVGPVVDLWAIGTDKARVPSQEEINQMLPLVNYKEISVDEENNSVKLSKENMEIDLGGIAKGYAADKIAEYLKENDIKKAIIDLGGNIFILGEKDKNTPFKVGIQDPNDEDRSSILNIDISNKSLVTSGIYERYIKEGDKLYHHMINPQTGYPFDNNLSSVTIISSSSIIGDGLSTTAYGLGLEEGLKLIENTDDTDAIFITKDKKIYTTSNLKNKLNLIDKSFKIMN